MPRHEIISCSEQVYTTLLMSVGLDQLRQGDLAQFLTAGRTPPTWGWVIKLTESKLTGFSNCKFHQTIAAMVECTMCAATGHEQRKEQGVT